jgi:hypothetical protein
VPGGQLSPQTVFKMAASARPSRRGRVAHRLELCVTMRLDLDRMSRTAPRILIDENHLADELGVNFQMGGNPHRFA